MGPHTHLLQIQTYFCKAMHTITWSVEEMPLPIFKFISLTWFLSLSLAVLCFNSYKQQVQINQLYEVWL
jgi:hypothetical protein